ncbi:DUF2256 domain-containing protein [Winogradskyella sediminis]|uniref:DUF2256 domain-containing protein n=1 Tax=Winogradskyella sediminis TaxID=1382466 RepID=A0A1H1MQV1_9FLAO|nr:DUF2256 domain-containing protein [Winogradskyella sediminis]SDR89116.1 hypothetical protein SAMN04489797_0398 [Winogradskyella sediminis]
MPKGIKKKNLSQKTCVSCNRPFTWRKKWARDWEHVKYCSDSCRKHNRLIHFKSYNGY